MTAEDVLLSAIEEARGRWSTRLVAGYAIGSLAHGGFVAEVSDVDVALLLDDPLAASDAAAASDVASAVARSVATPLATRLSIFWGSRGSLNGRADGGRFPAYDRQDLLESGRLLWGADIRGDLAAPAPRDLLLEGARFALAMFASPVQLGAETVDATSLLRRPESILDRGARDTTKLALFPVRFLYTSRAGRIGSTSAAVSHFLDREPAGPVERLVRAAASWRERGEAEMAAGRGLLRDGIVPLYLRFIDDYVVRLRTQEGGLLADRLLAWRAALTQGAP